MTTIERESLHDVFYYYKQFARLMCAEDVDTEDIQAAVDDACEAAHACTLPWMMIKTFQNMANEVAVLEQSNPQKASELEDTYLMYLESL